MIAALSAAGLLLGAAAVGTGSALLPLINAEAATLGAGTVAKGPLLIALALAIAVGQTVGKVLILEAARRGAASSRGRLLSRVRRSSHKQAKPSRWPARREAALALLGSPWRGGAIVAVSATLGLPPLALVSAGCGVAGMRRRQFATCCLVGRSVRFLVLVVPAIAWSVSS